ncbi:MAG: sulfatase-like hydrolase/transferase [Eubacteriales bacterium]
MKKPNIIIVMTDQQRADLRKSCGCNLDTMPFLDEWAKGGIDFSNAYTPNPICLAARTSMFTGRYSHSHQVRTNQNVEDILYTKDLLDILKENGYLTALCGKNHTYLEESEFDFCAGTGHLSNKITEETSEEYKEFAKFLDATGFVAGDEPAPCGVEVQHPYQNVTSALEFIDSVPSDTPFFTWVSFAEPHNPYQVPYPYYDMFPVDELPECVSAKEAKFADKGCRFDRMRDIWEHVYGPDVEERILRSRSNYYGMLRLIDDQFKRLVDGLRQRNIEDDTIVIYLSDHGDFVGEYGLMRKGGDLAELLIHIPMIWKGPGIIPTGKDTEHFVSLIDILPQTNLN